MEDGIKHVYQNVGIFRVTVQVDNSLGSDSAVLYLHVTCMLLLLLVYDVFQIVWPLELNSNLPLWKELTSFLSHRRGRESKRTKREREEESNLSMSFKNSGTLVSFLFTTLQLFSIFQMPLRYNYCVWGFSLGNSLSWLSEYRIYLILTGAVRSIWKQATCMTQFNVLSICISHDFSPCFV